MHCPSCGHENDDEHRFCASCGVDLRSLRVAEGPEQGVFARLARIIGRSRRERLITIGTSLAVTVAIVSFVALDFDDEPLAADDPYTLAVDAQCVEAKELVARRTGRAVDDGAGVAAYASDLAELLARWRTELLTLPPPAGRESEAEGLSQALLDLNGEFAALAAVGRDGEQAAIAAQAERVDEATVALEDTIAAAGLPGCDALGFSFGGSPVQ